MNQASQPFIAGPNTGPPPSYALRKEEYEIGELGPPHGPAQVTSTVVNVQPEVSVPDHIVWSLFNSMFFNFCCLGFVAFAYSVKSRDRKMVGDMTGAQSYASTAKCLNISALILGLLFNIGLIIGLVFLCLFLLEVLRMNRDKLYW